MALIGFRLISIVFALASITLPVSAQYADDAEMARQALSPYVGNRGVVGQGAEDKARIRIDGSHESIRTRAARNPDKELAVVIVLNRGHTVEEIGELAKRYELEVIDLHLKAPYTDKGDIQSVKIGSAELVRYEGEVAERAYKAIGAVRYKFQRMAKALPEDAAKEYRRMSKSEILVYRVEAYGNSSRIVDLLERSRAVSLVAAESDERSEEKIEFQKRMQSEADAGWQRIRENDTEVQAMLEKHREKLAKEAREE